jgi:hypothetical protein
MAKKSRTKTSTKTRNLKFTEKVPDEYVFWCCDNRKFTDMKELVEGLNTMSDDTYTYHVNAEKNDFCNWVRDIIKDEELATNLLQATSRMTAAQCAASRLAFLTDKSS